MPIAPIITFKAGQCKVDTSSTPTKVQPQPQPGYIYLYAEDDLVHFCWRKRDVLMDEPELDLVMVPPDGSFVPYEPRMREQPTGITNGRIFVLKFASSSQRYLFWLQSKPTSRADAGWLSPRDRKIGQIVHRLLKGEEVNVTRELSAVRNSWPDGDDDEPMQDAEPQHGPRDHGGGGSGGAGPDATGGDIREEGEGSREGGADGARAASSSVPDAATAVRNLLQSLGGQHGLSDDQRQPRQNTDLPYPYLSHLLPASTTVPLADAATSEVADTLLGFLPPAVIVLASGSPGFDCTQEPTAEAVEAAKASLCLDDKRALLKKVMRSPQFHQALGSLTMALRDGGLPGIADALGVQVENGGYIRDSGVPLGGGYAVKAFVEGVKKTVEEQNP